MFLFWHKYKRLYSDARSLRTKETISWLLQLEKIFYISSSNQLFLYLPLILLLYFFKNLLFAIVDLKKIENISLSRYLSENCKFSYWTAEVFWLST